MTLKEIKELIKSVGESNLTELKLEKKDFKISIKTDKQVVGNPVVTQVPTMMAAPQSQVISTPMAVPATTSTVPVETTSESADLLEVRSPIVGTFYRSPSPDKDVFVKVGDDIEVGSVVCIVEAMKLFNEIESEVAGKIVKVMLDDSSPVEYDQVLFLVDPNG